MRFPSLDGLLRAPFPADELDYLFQVEGRILAKTVLDDSALLNNPCWLWPGKVSQFGYMRCKIDGRTHLIHRWIYERRNGPAPKGFDLHHICQIKHCLNPNHLELLTRREHLERHEFAGTFKPQTHCKNGHEFTPENTYIRFLNGRPCKQCRTCNREIWKRWNQRRQNKNV